MRFGPTIREKITRALCLVLFTASLGIATPPVASASADLVPGMKILIGRGECSLGFFGSNGSNRLAVTAGHCSTALNQSVADSAGNPIGEVVSRMDDVVNSSGSASGPRGYTVIYLYDGPSIDPFFTSVGLVAEGDSISKFGGRSGKTNGHVIKGTNRPALLYSDIVQLPGDSGCPWYTSGPTLVAMASSGNQETAGGGGGSQAQPITNVVNLIRKNTGKWGSGFKVWTA
ncbi:Uncharacterised protein [Mycobacteroides abscessus subsp. massiliense]|nr:Uncharacterised protein [Mycobacteroides abscessus subsp. abscessus]SKM80495.1 Uncharacterised protein [Mycobacteroides abscessus subsp. massiliense]SKM99826.1 Uncharacterised protein [Mycobacteroides abscessus subsp. massiliense]SKV27647.1 Uncharacterised protein [Mycobacteroides abscessus subsp. abscessus]SLD45008.1 Uncharacterised protein [Mycobacteroides abscessus subsp. massiliense]